MDENIHLLGGVLDEAKVAINNRVKVLVKKAINAFFDYIEDKTKGFPETIKQLRNNPEIEQKLETLWSEILSEEGLVSKGYSGLPDNLLISNLHQEGYLDGLYVGYILAMMAMVDVGATQDLTLSVRDYMRPNLMKVHYNDRDEFIGQYRDGKYSWIDGSTRDTKNE